MVMDPAQHERADHAERGDEGHDGEQHDELALHLDVERLDNRLGIASVERNGQHYYAGLAQFTPALQAHALQNHGDAAWFRSLKIRKL